MAASPVEPAESAEVGARAVPEGKYADIGNGLRIHYHEAGPPDGFPVVFLHGSGPGASGYSNFRDNYPYFASEGFRVIVPDTLGFGYSSKPEDRDYEMDFLVECTKKLLDLKEKYGLESVGFGLGEPKGLEFAFAQRFASVFGTPNVVTPSHL